MKEGNKRGREGERQTLGGPSNGTECAEENKDYVRK
jgi:hypothetical protein